MKDLLAWGLQSVRKQTMNLVAGVPVERACSQAVPGEHHPVWTLGHLLLGDTYLLTLLGVDGLPANFQVLPSRYGPGAHPTGSADQYDAMTVLVQRLTASGVCRHAAVTGMAVADLARPTPDQMLARAQPTIAHHLQALVCHEGYHAGQLAAWRRTHGLPPSGWAFAPPAT